MRFLILSRSVGLKKKNYKKNHEKSRNSRPWYPRTTLKVNIHIFGLTKCTIYCEKCSRFCFLFLPFLRSFYSEGLIYGGKFAFQNRLGKPVIVGRKFTGFALFYFIFEGNFQVQAPSNLVPTAFPSKSGWGPTHFLRKSPGDEVEAPRRFIFAGAYTRRGLFSEFYGIRISLIFRALGTNHMFCSPQKTWGK